MIEPLFFGHHSGEECRASRPVTPLPALHCEATSSLPAEHRVRLLTALLCSAATSPKGSVPLLHQHHVESVHEYLREYCHPVVTASVRGLSALPERRRSPGCSPRTMGKKRQKQQSRKKEDSPAPAPAIGFPSAEDGLSAPTADEPAEVAGGMDGDASCVASPEPAAALSAGVGADAELAAPALVETAAEGGGAEAPCEDPDEAAGCVEADSPQPAQPQLTLEQRVAVLESFDGSESWGELCAAMASEGGDTAADALDAGCQTAAEMAKDGQADVTQALERAESAERRLLELQEELEKMRSQQVEGSHSAEGESVAAKILRLERQRANAATREAEAANRRAAAAEEAVAAARQANDVVALRARAEAAEAQARDALRTANDAAARADNATSQMLAARDEVSSLRGRIRAAEATAAEVATLRGTVRTLRRALDSLGHEQQRQLLPPRHGSFGALSDSVPLPSHSSSASWDDSEYASVSGGGSMEFGDGSVTGSADFTAAGAEFSSPVGSNGFRSANSSMEFTSASTSAESLSGADAAQSVFAPRGHNGWGRDGARGGISTGESELSDFSYLRRADLYMRDANGNLPRGAGRTFHPETGSWWGHSTGADKPRLSACGQCLPH